MRQNSLIEHHTVYALQEKHLNEAACRAAALRRHQSPAASSSQSAVTPNSSAPSGSPPVYPKDAALQAIKRFSIKPPYQEFTVKCQLSCRVAIKHKFVTYVVSVNEKYFLHFILYAVIPHAQEMKEGPVTKHIRLTSALILRNLARYSALGRR